MCRKELSLVKRSNNNDELSISFLASKDDATACLCKLFVNQAKLPRRENSGRISRVRKLLIRLTKVFGFLCFFVFVILVCLYSFIFVLFACYCLCSFVSCIDSANQFMKSSEAEGMHAPS